MKNNKTMKCALFYNKSFITNRVSLSSHQSMCRWDTRSFHVV